MARFFIDRPVFAWVIALLIVLAGVLALRTLPVSQYPDIAPPRIGIYASYPGASAEVVENAVAAVIEREMSGAPGLMYTSAYSSAGSAVVYLVFRQGTDPAMAAVETQNRMKAVEAILPEPVRRLGISVEKSIDNEPVHITLTSTDGSLTALQMGEFAATRLLQPLRRVDGVGKAEAWAPENAMRIWLDPIRMRAMAVDAETVMTRVRHNNARITIGELGHGAVPSEAGFSGMVLPPECIASIAEFGAISLRTREDGSVVKLSDVARIELGQNHYTYDMKLNGDTAISIAVDLAPGSNAMATVAALRAVMQEQSATFPPGMTYQIPFEPSEFVKLSIRKVLVTLLEAMLLVFLVMYLFMQNIRATLIPALVVPVALLGTLAVLPLFGFSINVLTLFGMVLAIGILVDDAIVVVENVERLMVEQNLSPRKATIQAMRQIGGAVIGITVVLISVFVPMAFFGGAVGNIYRQFAVTLAVSIAFSAFLALSLTPALCATLLRPVAAGHADKKGFFGWFNRHFARGTERYGSRVQAMTRRPWRWMALYPALLLAVVWLALRLPTAFLPSDDQGLLTVSVVAPSGATTRETQAGVDAVDRYLRQNEPVAYALGMTGYSPFGRGPNAGALFVTLYNWSDRRAASQHVDAIVERINLAFEDHANLKVFAFSDGGVPGLGSASGFNLQLQDRAGLGHARLAEARDSLLAAAKKESAVDNVRFSGMADQNQLKLAIDRRKAQAMGIQLEDINTTLAVMFSSDYAGDFLQDGQIRRIILQADGTHRLQPADLLALTVRNGAGNMVALATFATLEWTVSPPQLSRYNGYPSMPIGGDAASGSSSGAALQTMERLLAGLPPGIGYEWSGKSREEKQSGSDAPLLFAMSILIIFLALAALYESWTIPLAVILVVPLGIVGALLGVTLRDLPNDIYFKVGLVATIGLSAKNAVLIIEVAQALHREGRSLIDAAVEAARRRLRPIVMTSMAFGVGVLPLVLASGAGSAAQIAVGTGVLGGIVTATGLAIFMVPLFFVIVGRCFPPRRGHIAGTDE